MIPHRMLTNQCGILEQHFGMNVDANLLYNLVLQLAPTVSDYALIRSMPDTLQRWPFHGCFSCRDQSSPCLTLSKLLRAPRNLTRVTTAEKKAGQCFALPCELVPRSGPMMREFFRLS